MEWANKLLEKALAGARLTMLELKGSRARVLQEMPAAAKRSQNRHPLGSMMDAGNLAALRILGAKFRPRCAVPPSTVGLQEAAATNWRRV